MTSSKWVDLFLSQNLSGANIVSHPYLVVFVVFQDEDQKVSGGEEGEENDDSDYNAGGSSSKKKKRGKKRKAKDSKKGGKKKKKKRNDSDISEPEPAEESPSEEAAVKKSSRKSRGRKSEPVEPEPEVFRLTIAVRNPRICEGISVQFCRWDISQVMPLGQFAFYPRLNKCQRRYQILPIPFVYFASIVSFGIIYYNHFLK